jgi:2-succinyl-6-hydroxy-2,4-cyclohexadiene-1-carboxylate synthase
LEKLNLFFLHGFLGRPADWGKVLASIPEEKNLRLNVPDYFNMDALNPTRSLSEWAENFNEWAKRSSQNSGKNIFIGYSLGGRLGLHALANNPSFWDEVILISTNPGFNDDCAGFEPTSEIRRQRWLTDSFWAQEFLTGSWETTLRNWNAQPIFSGGEDEPRRDEAHYSRDNLSLALTHWSLANQKNMRKLIKEQAHKIHWLVGSRDEKFVQMAENLKLENPKLKVEVIDESSHRVLFDRPKSLAEKIQKLLKTDEDFEIR